MKSFSELGLSESLMRVLPEMGFEKPSPIQEQAIPLLNLKNTRFYRVSANRYRKNSSFWTSTA